MTIEKLIRDGKVAVLVSHGFGAGWSSWQPEEHVEFALHDRQLCEFTEAGDFEGFKARAEEVIGEFVYFGGLRNVCVEWVEQGKPFYVHEYDGSEHLVTDFRVA
jgi:hypothetical protein